MKIKSLSIMISSLVICTNAFASSSAQDYATTLNTLANTTVTAKANYFPVQIIDHLKDNNQQGITNAYLLMVAKNIPLVETDPANTCVMNFSPENLGGKTVAVGDCVVPQVGHDIGQKAQALSSLPGYDATTHSVLVYIPEVQSGRAFLSLNHKLSMYALQTGNTISYQAPDDSNKQDPSYDIIYDKFEFTYGSDGVFWINPTSVDFFSIPISLIEYGTAETSGDLQASSGAPLNQTRTEIINNMNQTLITAGSPWTDLLHTYDGTNIRISAPHIAPDFPTSSYLSSYVTNFINYYKDNKTLTINCSELIGDASNPMPLGEKYGYVPSGPDKGQPKYPANLYPELYEFTGKINEQNQFVFSNQAGVDQVNENKGTNLQAVSETIDLNNTAQIAKGFFQPGQACTAFATPNKTLQSVLVKNITAAWSVGLLTPSSDQDVSLSTNYFENHKSDYYQTGSYDVYAKAIHLIMPNTYAYPYDDVVKQDGTLNSNNNTQPVTVVFGDMSGVNIPTPPPPTQFKPATVTGITANQQDDALYCDGTNCTASVTFTAPVQKEVSYYPLAHNLFHIITVDDLAKKQTIISGTNQGTGVQNYTSTLTIPQSDVIGAPALGSTGSVDGLQVQVFSCSNLPGGNCPGVTRASGVGNPTSSAVYPKANVNVLPVTINAHAGYTCSGGSCSVTLNWTIPRGQGDNVKYYIGLQGYNLGTAAGFENGVYSLTSAGATTQTINVSKNDLNPTLTEAQVFSCSTSDNNCPTSTNNYSPVNAAPGSATINLTPPSS